MSTSFIPPSLHARRPDVDAVALHSRIKVERSRNLRHERGEVGRKVLSLSRSFRGWIWQEIGWTIGWMGRTEEGSEARRRMDIRTRRVLVRYALVVLRARRRAPALAAPSSRRCSARCLPYCAGHGTLRTVGYHRDDQDSGGRRVPMYLQAIVRPVCVRIILGL
jgi:hypothetical protein